jgi:hypothetical protein
MSQFVALKVEGQLVPQHYTISKRREVHFRLSDELLSGSPHWRCAPDTVPLAAASFGPAEPLVPMKRLFPDNRKCVPDRDVKRPCPSSDMEDYFKWHYVESPAADISRKSDLQEYRPSSDATTNPTNSSVTSLAGCQEPM